MRLGSLFPGTSTKYQPTAQSFDEKGTSVTQTISNTLTRWPCRLFRPVGAKLPNPSPHGEITPSRATIEKDTGQQILLGAVQIGRRNGGWAAGVKNIVYVIHNRIYITSG